VLKIGDKVDNSTAALLTKLNIKPFFYGLELKAVWDDGVVFSAADLQVTDEVISGAFSTAISNITAVSLGAGIPTEASLPHLLVDAFKNLLAASVASDYVFEEFNGKTLRDDIKSGKAAAAAAPAKAAAAAAPAKAAKEEKPKEEEEDDDIGMGLFF
jgi:large subunit ribosomal protein LP0